MSQDDTPVGLTSWVFFAAGAKPTSMRRALAVRLAEVEPVVIVGQPISLLRERRLPTLGERIMSLGGKHAWLYQPLHFPELVPLAGYLSRTLNRSSLKAELDQLLPRGVRRIVCYDSPTQHHLAGRLGEQLSIYLAVDDRTFTVRGQPIAGELAAEMRLLQKVDQVVCVSEALARTLRSRACSRGSLPIHVMHNGYDERLFNPAIATKEPAALSVVSRPRVLVAGHISERIDWDGIAEAAKICPDWTWVFIGPADHGMADRIWDLATMSRSIRSSSSSPAFVWLGSLPVEKTPEMIAHCDACAVPYRLNPFTCASSPLKAIECLAMGVPVLSTKVPSLLRYDGAIHWVEQGDGGSYARALINMRRFPGSGAGTPRKTRDVSNESWSVKARQFRDLVLADLAR